MPKKPAPRRRGQIIERGDRKWLVRVNLGVGPDGSRKTSAQIVLGTYKQAEMKLNEMLRGQDTNTFVAPSKNTLGEYLTQWIEQKRDITEKSKHDYELWINSRIIPALGHVKLSKLSKYQIQAFYGSLSSDHALSRRTIQCIHAVLRLALNVAVEDQLLARNPAIGATDAIPQAQRETAEESMKAFSFEELSAFLEKSAGQKHAFMWRFFLMTGMRPQEALALKWSDIETVVTENGPTTYVTVNRSLMQTSTGVYFPRDFHTKRKASRRTIPLDAETAAQLVVYRKAQLEVIMKAGAKYDRTGDWVFSTPRGTFRSPTTVRRDWRVTISALGFPPRRLYDARHTHLSHLLSTGMSPKAVAQRAGQSNAVTLLTTYAHVMKQDQQAGLEAITKRLARAAAEG